MPPPTPSENPTTIPLCVDLDGTLIKTDMLWELLVRLVKKNPLAVVPIALWWTHGRAFLKQQLAARVSVNAADLPRNEKFVAWLRAEHQSGRRLVLATASDIKMAEPVAAYFGCFDEVLASDGKINLRSENKLRLLREKFGERGFDYAGNATADYAVWRGARQAIVVNAPPAVEREARGLTIVAQVFKPDSTLFSAFIRSLRPHQWVKNLILLVPLIAGHKLNEPALIWRAVLGVIVFCLCASGVYFINDLMDLDQDRRHRSKRNRPLAAGDLPLQAGLIGGPLLLGAGIILAAQLSRPFLEVTLGYVVLTTLYSWLLKKVVLLDVIFLAGLYTLRLFAGSVATRIIISPWLLMFSMAIFLSLALVKRFVELDPGDGNDEFDPNTTRRGYLPHHARMVALLGLGSGGAAVLVLATYVNMSRQVLVLYRHPLVLLGACPLLLFWVIRVWWLARCGKVHDDPVVFALKDRVSYLVGALAFLVMWLAAK
jgi:4-hydroxybenzoate polyprenyltransferase/phosphoserine phosphatase